MWLEKLIRKLKKLEMGRFKFVLKVYIEKFVFK
jgi:hypothetical protein